MLATDVMRSSFATINPTATVLPEHSLALSAAGNCSRHWRSD